MTRVSGKERYSTVVILLSSFFAIVFSVTINILLLDRSAKLAEHERHMSEMRQCQMFVALIAAYNDPPPESETGKSVASAYVDQYNALNCAIVLTTK